MKRDPDKGWLYDSRIGFAFHAPGLDVANRIHRAMLDAAEAKALELGVEIRLEESTITSSPQNFGSVTT